MGGTNVRLIREARVAHVAESDEVREWASGVHVLEQRLLLRVPATDAVATMYLAVRQALIALDEDQQDDPDHAVTDFETKRDAFLTAARAALEAEVS